MLTVKCAQWVEPYPMHAAVSIPVRRSLGVKRGLECPPASPSTGQVLWGLRTAASSHSSCQILPQKQVFLPEAGAGRHGHPGAAVPAGGEAVCSQCSCHSSLGGRHDTVPCLQPLSWLETLLHCPFQSLGTALPKLVHWFTERVFSPEARSRGGTLGKQCVGGQEDKQNS